jgi:8-oxo-dGTP pyrophosphatase MutT (NUDIX family)
MHRSAVLKLLRDYAAEGLVSDESAVLQDTICFIDAHEDCLCRTQLAGHLTGSAWIVNAARTHTLLTHHRKLDKWLQLGGHADGDPDLLRVALKEAREESGLTYLRPVHSTIFDVDRHLIPARKQEPAHYHYDLRFLIEADPREPLTVTNESNDLAWVELSHVTALNPEESMARMVRKTSAPKFQ